MSTDNEEAFSPDFRPRDHLKRFAQGILEIEPFHADIVTITKPPHTCEYCPLGAQPSPDQDDINNDRSEARYDCPIMGKPVWGENPSCQKGLDAMLRLLYEDACDWPAIVAAKAEAERKKQEQADRDKALRIAAIATLSDEQIKALGISNYWLKEAGRTIKE